MKKVLANKNFIGYKGIILLLLRRLGDSLGKLGFLSK